MKLWMNSQGGLIQCISHSSVAAIVLKRNIRNDNDYDVLEMYKLGYARLGVDGDTVYVEYLDGLTKQQTEAVFNYAEQNNLKIENIARNIN